MARIILHVDLDAFFAAVEERQHPEYQGKPIIVGANPKEGKGRGVVSTANYIARQYGIHSGMPISKAWKKCPNGIFLPVNMPLYEKVSKSIMDILRAHADKFEQVSIDEAFLDISKRVQDFDQARAFAILLKEKIYEKEGLTCSIGIGPNKLIAKIASDFQKPDGLTVVKPEEVKDFLAPLDVQKIWGIGPKTAEKMAKLGIKTIGELAKYPVEKLIKEFGKLGYEFHKMAQGIDESEVEERQIIKSVGREHTFESDTKDEELIYNVLSELTEEVWKEIKNQFCFRTVTVKIRYADFETHTHAKTLPSYTDKKEDIITISKELIKPFLRSEKAIRLIGVRVSNLLQGKVTLKKFKEK